MYTNKTSVHKERKKSQDHILSRILIPNSSLYNGLCPWPCPAELHDMQLTRCSPKLPLSALLPRKTSHMAIHLSQIEEELQKVPHPKMDQADTAPGLT